MNVILQHRYLHDMKQREMKRILFCMVLCLLAVTGRSQMGDALKGIWPVTDKSVMKSLNGQWQLKVVSGIGDARAVPPADDTWGHIPVPGCWEAHGFCKPSYSFPDSLTGYYRTAFQIPPAWKGRRVIIRFDGVLRGYDLWLNDHYVGTWEQAYNTCLFDLTPHLTKNAFRGGQQQLAMRVYSRFKGHEFDNFDDWAPMGIFRDVTLFSVPETHLSDLTVTTKTNGEVTVNTVVVNRTKHTTVGYDILDASGNVLPAGSKIERPRLWTAETPYLYTLRVYVKEKGKTLQTFTQKIGIREVTIDGNVLKVNGRPVKLRGVTCHSTDPTTVKVISDDLTLKDMRMMKEASVNYIRTSHYPREPRFFELADSLGFYVVCEAPFGSRGEKHLTTPDYFDILRTRVKATIDSHKNHPSVIVWSLGNENPLPKSCEEVGEYAWQLDSTRPYCFPQKGSTFRGIGFERFPKQVPLYAPHYPTTGQLRDYYTKTDRPLIFTEYCHTLGISFEDHDRQWEIIERTPGIAGGSVWEWVDQGMPFRASPDPSKGGESSPPSPDPSEGGESIPVFSRWRTDGSECDQKVYTSATGGFEMKGNFGTDGLLYADRTPLPNYYELQHNYARAFVASADFDSLAAGASRPLSVRLQCRNRYDFLDLKDNVVFHWTLTSDRDTVAQGSFSPACPPRSTSPCVLTLPGLPQGLSLLHFDIEERSQTGGPGHTFLHQSFVLNRPKCSADSAGEGCGLYAWTGTGDPMQFVQEGPLVRTGRKPTMAERITQKGRLPQKYLLPLRNSQVKADIVTKPVQGGEEVTFTLLPDSADVFRAELGLAYLLDKRIDRVQWIGQGPFASYPGRHQACRYGIWAKLMDDLYFEGNHGGVDAAFFSDKDGNGLLFAGDSLDVNFEQTDRGIVVTVNAAVSGQGPKFARTAFPGWQPGNGAVGDTFRIYSIKEGNGPDDVSRLFVPAKEVPAPFMPFLTQYDTYLLKYSDIRSTAVPVILTAGQSNADGRVPMADLPEELRDYHYCLWSYGSGDFETATGQFSKYSPRVAKPKTEQSWGFDAVVYKKLEQLWQQPFYVIKQTDGGTAIDPSCKASTHGLYWSADKTFLDTTASAGSGGKSLLKAFERQIDDCLKHLPEDYDIKCLLWHQGESDRPAADRYYDNLKAVIAHIRRHLVEVTGRKRYSELPVVCATFSKDSRQGSAEVAGALLRLEREDEHFHVVDASDLTLLRDRLHFDAQGAQTLGQRFFDTMKQQQIVE